MYMKNLTESFRIRFSETDMDFLRKLSDERGVSISECVRSIIGEYRRSLDTMRLFTEAINLVNKEKEKEGELSNGDTKTDFNYQLQH